MNTIQTLRQALIVELLKHKSQYPIGHIVKEAKELEDYIIGEEESLPLPNDLQPKPGFWDEFIGRIKTKGIVQDEDGQNPYISKEPSPFTMRYSAAADPSNFVQTDTYDSETSVRLARLLKEAQSRGYITTAHLTFTTPAGDSGLVNI